jgi:hypothetical protein
MEAEGARRGVNVEVHIERVTLDGIRLGPAERAALSHTLCDELGALIKSGGIPTRLVSTGALPSLPTGAVQMPAPRAPGPLGRALANGVYTSFGGA